MVKGTPSSKPSNNPTNVHEPSPTRPPSEPTPKRPPDPQEAEEASDDTKPDAETEGN